MSDRASLNGSPGTADLDQYARRLDLCVYCPKLCRHVCPVAVEEGRETSTPWGLMTLIALVRDGMETPSPEWGEALAHCTSCGRCQRACLHHNDVTDPILEARRLAWESGVAPAAARAVAGDFAARTERLAARLAELAPAPAPAELPMGDAASGTGGPVAYLPGCAMVESAPDDVRRSVDLFARLGVGDVVLPGCGVPAAACCGEPLRSAGAIELFAAHGRALAARLGGHRLVVAGDPACAATLRAITEVTGVGMPPVQTAVEVVAELLGGDGDEDDEGGDGNVTSGATPVILHEPCEALRDGATARAARALARAAGLSPHALPPGDRSSACCGGRGGLPDSVPTTAAALARHVGAEAARERIRRGIEPGAAPLVTSGSRCAAHLRACGVDVRTIWEMLERELGG